jgi:hypothetical protein
MKRETQGKIVVIEGGGYTSEARELKKKLQLLEQLRLARRLRATMEAAYQDAKQSNDTKKASEILTRHNDTILEMASLTDAVRGGYTLDSYIEYKLDQKRESDRLRHLNAQHIFSSIRKKMAKERNSTDCSSIRKRNREEERSVSNEDNSKSKSIEGSHKKKRKYEDKSATSIHSGSMPQDDDTSVKEKVVELQKSTKQSTRKCHYCKKARADYIPCTYWHVNGKQCKKSFCLACIAANPRFNKISDGGNDFHCPSCLCTCDCESCLRFREQKRQSARVSRRLAQGNSS